MFYQKKFIFLKKFNSEFSLIESQSATDVLKTTSKKSNSKNSESNY